MVMIRKDDKSYQVAKKVLKKTGSNLPKPKEMQKLPKQQTNYLTH